MDEIGISGSKVGEGALARDVRRLKSATLDRMGKMLKIHSKSSGEKVRPFSSSSSTVAKLSISDRSLEI